MNTSARFDAEFQPLLDRGEEVSAQGLELIDELLPPGLTFDALPTSTRLCLSSTSTYRAALATLGVPETSIAALSLLRGLLEALAHLHFIGDPSDGGDPRCRALRY